MRAAHEALLSADPKVTTVTDIATAHGFFELGQFAARYRKAFGEVPSQTLRHLASHWAAAARTGAALQAAPVSHVEGATDTSRGGEGTGDPQALKHAGSA